MSRREVFGLVVLSFAVLIAHPALAQGSYTKAYVGDRIRKVEDAVDEFQKWTEKRGEDAKNRVESGESSNRTARRGRTNSSSTSNTQARSEQAQNTKDELDEALGDLDRSTNRLRRKFDPTDAWMNTKEQVEKVVEDARRINEVMVRGKYGTDAERYWNVLKTGINDLARTYGVPPLGTNLPATGVRR